MSHFSPTYQNYRCTVNEARRWLRWSVLRNKARWFIWLCHCVDNLVNLYSFPTWPTRTDRPIFVTGKHANRTIQWTEGKLAHIAPFLLHLCSFQSTFCPWIAEVRGLTHVNYCNVYQVSREDFVHLFSD